MPITKSAIKREKQNEVRRRRLLPYRTHMKTMVRRVKDLVSQGKKEEAKKILPLVYKAIDLAAKKKIIHTNTASRRKSRVGRFVG